MKKPNARLREARIQVRAVAAQLRHAPNDVNLQTALNVATLTLWLEESEQ